MNNEERADLVKPLVEAFAISEGLNISLEADGPAMAAGDMICDLLHYVQRETGSWQEALDAARSGIAHFASEQNIPEEMQGEDIGPVADVDIQVVCNDVVWRSKTGSS